MKTTVPLCLALMGAFTCSASSTRAQGLPDDLALDFSQVRYDGRSFLASFTQYVQELRTVPYTVTREVLQTRTKIENGREVTYTVTVPVTETMTREEVVTKSVIVEEAFNEGEVKFGSAAGQFVSDISRVKQHLRTPRIAVVLPSSRTLHPFFQKALKPSTIVMYIPDAPPAPAPEPDDLFDAPPAPEPADDLFGDPAPPAPIIDPAPPAPSVDPFGGS